MSAAWGSGSLRGLAIALLFILSVQTAWIGTFIWPAFLSAWEAKLLWWSVAFSALGSVLYQTCYVSWADAKKPRKCDDPLLGRAQALYLQGNFFEAEELLTPHVSQGEWDIEAALWLASIYRRTGRYEAAGVVLETIESLERGAFWSAEIADEHRKIKESRRNKRLESL